MKKLIAILVLVVLAEAGFGQRTYVDTIIANHCVRIDWDLTGNTKEGIFYMPGAGQVGGGTLADTQYIKQFGYEMWILGGWNGQVALGNGTHRPVQVSIIQTTTDNCCGYMRFFTMKTVLDSFRNTRFRSLIKDSAWHAIGFSAGGWVWDMFNVAQASATDTAYYSYFKSMVDIEGVIPNDVGGTYPFFLGYPQRFGHRAKVKRFGFLGFMQVGDGSRGIDSMTYNINDSVPGSAHFAWSNYNGGGHTAFDSFTSPYVNNWTASNPNLVTTSNGNTSVFLPNGESVIQWQLRQGDTALSGGGPYAAPTGYAGPAQFIQLPTSSVTLTGTATPGSGASITSTTWSVVVDSMGLLHGGLTIASPSSLTTTLSGITHWTNIVVKLHILQSDGQTLDTTMHIQVDPAHNASAPRKLWLVPTQTSPSYEVDLPTTAGTVTGALPGDSLFIPAPSAGKNYDLVRLGWISGTRGQPIVVTVDSSFLIYHGRIVTNSYSQYIQWNFQRLVHVTGGGADAFQGLLCNHIDITGLLIDSVANGAGFFIKTQEDTTTANWEHRFPNYDMVSIIIRNCVINHTQGNGMYLGSTNPWGTDGGQPPGLPPRMDSVQVYNDTLLNIGQTAISVSNSRDGMSVHDNYCNNIGIGPGNAGGPFAIGMELGANTSGVVYNNKFIKVLSNGIEVFGYGTIDTYNNYYDSCGWNNTGSAENTYISNDNVAPAGHFETNPAQSLIIRNSTFKDLWPGAGAEAAAIRAFNSGGTQNAMNVHDNVMCIPGANPLTWQGTYIIGSPSPTLLANSLLCGIPIINHLLVLRARRYKVISH